MSKTINLSSLPTQSLRSDKIKMSLNLRKQKNEKNEEKTTVAIKRFDSSVYEWNDPESTQKLLDDLKTLVNLSVQEKVDVDTPTAAGRTLFQEACELLYRICYFDLGQRISKDVSLICLDLLDAGAFRSELYRFDASNHPLSWFCDKLLTGNGELSEVVGPILDVLDENHQWPKSDEEIETETFLLGTFLHRAVGEAVSNSYDNPEISRNFRNLLDILGRRISARELERIVNHKVTFREFDNKGQLGFPLSLRDAECDTKRNMEQKPNARHMSKNASVKNVFLSRIEKSRRLEELTFYGGGLLHRVLKYTSPYFTSDILRSVLDYGASPHDTDSLLQNPLHLIRNPDDVRVLLDWDDTEPSRKTAMLLLQKDLFGRTPFETIAKRFRENPTTSLEHKLSEIAILFGTVLSREIESSSVPEPFQNELNNLLKIMMVSKDPETVKALLKLGADPFPILMNEKADGFYALCNDDGQKWSFQTKFDAECLLACIASAQKLEPGRFDIYDPDCPDIQFLKEFLHGAVLEPLMRELTHERDSALDKLIRQSEISGYKRTEWEQTIDGIPLIHHAAMTGRLPETFFSDPKMEIWNRGILDADGHSVAYTAMRFGNLPEGFDKWDSKERNGGTLAHSAAVFGLLPEDESLLNIKDSSGETVKEMVMIAASMGVVQKFWKDPPGLDPNENPHLVKDIIL